MNLRALATEIVRRLQQAGFEPIGSAAACAINSSVAQPGDYDIATSARPVQNRKLFQHTIPVGRQFGVIIVLVEGHQFQVATLPRRSRLRRWPPPQPRHFFAARSPTPAAATSPSTACSSIPCASNCTIGSADRRTLRKLVRTIGVPTSGSPKTIAAPARRALRRATRFSNRAADLRRRARERREDPNRQRRAHPRRAGEAFPAPRTPRAASTCCATAACWTKCCPNSPPTIGCAQSPDYHPEGTVYEHLRLMLSHLPPDAPPSLPWAVLLHDIAKPATASHDPATGEIHFYEHERVGAGMAAAILRRLRFSNKQLDEIVACVRQHIQFKDVTKMRKATLRRLLLRETSAGTEVAPPRLPRLPRPARPLRVPPRTSRRARPAAADSPAAPHRQRPDRPRHESWPGDGQAAGGDSREATPG